MIFNKTVGRVCNIKHTFTYFIKHNKMTLFPMHYARQRYIVFKLFGGDMNTECLESYIFGSLAYTEHTHPLTTVMTFLPQCIQAIMPAIMFCYHSQTSRTAVHGIILGLV